MNMKLDPAQSLQEAEFERQLYMESSDITPLLLTMFTVNQIIDINFTSWHKAMMLCYNYGNASEETKYCLAQEFMKENGEQV